MTQVVQWKSVLRFLLELSGTARATYLFITKLELPEASMWKEAIRDGSQHKKWVWGRGKGKNNLMILSNPRHFPVTQASTFPLWCRPLTLEARVVWTMCLCFQFLSNFPLFFSLLCMVSRAHSNLALPTSPASSLHSLLHFAEDTQPW